MRDLLLFCLLGVEAFGHDEGRFAAVCVGGENRAGLLGLLLLCIIMWLRQSINFDLLDHCLQGDHLAVETVQFRETVGGLLLVDSSLGQGILW